MPDLTQRHQEILTRTRERRALVRKEYTPLAPPAPVHHVVYWGMALVGVLVIGALGLAWYAMASLAVLARESAEREERLLDLLAKLSEEQVPSNDVGWIIFAVLIGLAVVAWAMRTLGT